MIVITIDRLEENEDCIRGVLSIDGVLFGATLELPWGDNQRNVSCIPEGLYEAVAHVSGKYGDTIRLLDVENRDAILFHAGNTSSDTKGCILLGSSFGVLYGRPAVLASSRMMDSFHAVLSTAGVFDVEPQACVVRIRNRTDNTD